MVAAQGRETVPGHQAGRRAHVGALARPGTGCGWAGLAGVAPPTIDSRPVSVLCYRGNEAHRHGLHFWLSRAAPGVASDGRAAVWGLRAAASCGRLAARGDAVSGGGRGM